MVTIAYRTGMRRGEVLGLQWRDIDLASTAPMLSVARQLLAIQDGQPVVGPPKTETSRRRIMLDAGTAGLLHSLHATQSGDWVIQCKHECPPSPNWITKVMHNACLRAEIPHRSFHSLRHTHATLLLAAGVNPKVVQERLGHAHIEMTLGIYGHVLPSMQAAAVAALDRLP
jgi:integrase